MDFRFIIAAVILSILPNVSLAKDAGTSYEYTKVLVTEKCNVSGASSELAPAVLAAMILPKLIDYGISGTATMLQKAGEQKDSPVYGKAVTDFFSIEGINQTFNKNVGCVTILTGKFGPKLKGSSGHTVVGPAEPKVTEADGGNTIIDAEPDKQTAGEEVPAPTEGVAFRDFKGKKAGTLKSYGLVTDPKLIIELAVYRSPDGSAFRLVPQLLYYGDYVESSIFPSYKRDLVVSLDFKNPSVDEPKNSFGHAELKFEHLKPVTLLDKTALEHITTNWMPVPKFEATFSSLISDVKTKEEQKKSLESNLKKVESEIVFQRYWLNRLLEENRKAAERSKAEAAGKKGKKGVAAEEREIELPRPAEEYGEDKTELQLLCFAEARKHQLDPNFNVTPECSQEEVTLRRTLLALLRQKVDLTSQEKAIDDEIKRSREKVSKMSKTGKTFPVNIEAAIVETKKANQYLLNASQFLKDNKAEISKTITTEAVTTERVKAEEAERKEQQTKREADLDLAIKVIDADKDVIDKNNKLTQAIISGNASEIELAKQDVKAAKLKANVALRNAGETRRYEISD